VHSYAAAKMCVLLPRGWKGSLQVGKMSHNTKPKRRGKIIAETTR